MTWNSDSLLFHFLSDHQEKILWAVFSSVWIFFFSLFLEKGNPLTVETICEVLSFTSLQHSKHSGNIWTDVKDRKTVQLFIPSSHGINRKLHAFNLQTKNVNPGAGDMTRQLNAYTALAEDLNLVPST